PSGESTSRAGRAEANAGGGALRDLESEADIPENLSPERRFPAVHFELLRVEGCDRQGAGCGNELLHNIFWSQLQRTPGAPAGSGQAIDCEGKARQYLVVDDVLQEHCVRIESIRVQHDAVF